MNITPNYIVDQNGKPVSVILPYEEFKEMVEQYGLDLNKDEMKAIKRGTIVRKKGLKAVLKEYEKLED
ncbi:MAG: hypothetical protein C4539_15995 [Ignavibacteriales bacterium]|nr:MAG: hypothetical protein C4539_15995 [Ignavibacteriales bacterium]